MIATGTVQSQTRSVIPAESVIEDGDGNPVGRGTGTFIRSHMRRREHEKLLQADVVEMTELKGPSQGLKVGPFQGLMVGPFLRRRIV